jgi:hypothetical protein
MSMQHWWNVADSGEKLPQCHFTRHKCLRYLCSWKRASSCVRSGVAYLNYSGLLRDLQKSGLCGHYVRPSVNLLAAMSD